MWRGETDGGGGGVAVGVTAASLRRKEGEERVRADLGGEAVCAVFPLARAAVAVGAPAYYHSLSRRLLISSLRGALTVALPCIVDRSLTSLGNRSAHRLCVCLCMPACVRFASVHQSRTDQRRLLSLFC